MEQATHTDPARQLAHAHAVRARGSALPSEGLPGSDILDSWVRSMAAGLDARGTLVVPVVGAAELQQRRARSEAVRRLARAELETLSRQIAGSNFLLAFADSDGVILDLYADNRFSMSSDAGIDVGSCWREPLVGTNGLGTALATGRSVAVTGLEHYFLSLGGISCTATPVRDAHGEIVGVLDASSYFESRQRHTQALVQMAATHIENGLLAHQMRRHWLLAVHPRAEFLGTLSAGMLAFDDGGRLLAINVRGRHLLQGLDAAPGTTFEALFGEAFGPLTARLLRDGDQRLRDVLGSTLVTRCIGRPAAPVRARPPSAEPRAFPAIGSGQAAITTAVTAALTDDPAVAEAYALVAAAVRIQVPILIHGETGCGKELLARHAHQVSGRHGAFVAVNCGAVPDDLFEAELFGYVGGAFSGARRDGSPGLIASADGGTLLLDEVRELPLPLQAALLRFLDDREVRPVGGTTSRRVDVQVLAASHADLDDEVEARRFRSDLLYRLNTVRANLPPLRERSDFAAAVRATLAALDRGATLDDAALERLRSHRWPGNFRELRSLLTRALLQGRRHLGVADVEPWLPPLQAEPVPGSVLQHSAGELVRREFARCGSVTRAAQALGVSRTTVYRHLRRPGR